jgi:Fe-S cluster assembly protein SufD
MCDGSENTQQVFVYSVTVEPNSILNLGIFAKNGKLNKHIFECEIYDGAVLNIFGLSENQVGGSCEIITKIYHAGTDAESNIFINSVSGKESRTVFQGQIQIQENMTNSLTQISNSSLVVDPSGQAFSIPHLLIDCGNTEAGQSCDVGEFDPMQLWYLQSRGVDIEDAKKILIDAHIDGVLNLIQYTDLRDEIKEFYRD